MIDGVQTLRKELKSVIERITARSLTRSGWTRPASVEQEDAGCLRLVPVSSSVLSSGGRRRRPCAPCGGRRRCFCSLIWWGCERRAPLSCSPLFLPSWVLTFPSCSLPPEPHAESARAVRPGPGRISGLSPGPRPGAGGGPPSPHHSQSKCHLLLTCKTLTIAPPGAAISSSGGKEY